MLTALLAGFGLCLSLIVAPGAQNVFLLREGIRHAREGRRHAIILAAVCLASDVILISVGVAGFGVIVEHAPWVLPAAKWAGVAFLAGYGLFAAWRTIRPKGEAIEIPRERDTEPAPEPLGGGTTTLTKTRRRPASATLPAVLTVLAITWLNPHTYLDTALMLGSVSTAYGDDRWLFAIGGILGSATWFVFLTFAARFAARWLRSPRSWRILDGLIAVVMLGVASALALG
ncbi:LysE/ArgO family amino acid transporter [Microbacterium sp. G2-8]|uniref:LysE/ArgO family amino acid transporter n=1 Tax=Microbacterium sp. G2-8 TaxID=2842454 RepID=UPI001C89C079|nr:LysE family transporter [Microbacterium sp. G2-8]